jgi:hypothetical protein
MPDTTTFKLRKMLMAERLGVSIETLEKHVTFRDVVEDDEGFTAIWVTTELGYSLQMLLKSKGHTREVPEVTPTWCQRAFNFIKRLAR